MDSLWIFAVLLLALFQAQGQEIREFPPLPSGLSFNFYAGTCPMAEFIVQKRVEKFLRQDITEAAGLIRIVYHDCFVQGCDASVLLHGEDSELASIPNSSLRPKSLQLINDIKLELEEACPGTVSCADIIALTARDATRLGGGPRFFMPTGRKDSKTAGSIEDALNNLPSPFGTVDDLLESFGKKGLNLTDLVALSGAHTVGHALCGAVFGRLKPTVDPDMDPSFADTLLETCPKQDTDNSTNLDVLSPTVFDNKYYEDLINKKGVLKSDQLLLLDPRTKDLVLAYARHQNQFFWQFQQSLVKMSQVAVLTGGQGEIRRNCSVSNPSLLVASS